MFVRAGAAVVAAVIASPSIASAQAPQFTISGTSTVRAWSCPAQGTEKVTPGTTAPAVPGFPKGLQVTVTVPVKEITCDTDLMNDHLREAMNEKSHPDIVYEMTHGNALAGSDVAHTTGNLTINGVTKPVSFDVKLSPLPEGMRATGETTIDLTQYSISPPVVFEGMLKVGKDVRVKFDTVLPAQK